MVNVFAQNRVVKCSSWMFCPWIRAVDSGERERTVFSPLHVKMQSHSTSNYYFETLRCTIHNAYLIDDIGLHP